jgi:hypothetical protein
MGVNLIGVHLLMGVHVTGMCLMGVYLMDVYLTGVHLMGVYLINVHLTDVHLMDVYLMVVDLSRPERCGVVPIARRKRPAQRQAIDQEGGESGRRRAASTFEG